jgi:NADH-quinone oxidoreductase subunit J
MMNAVFYIAAFVAVIATAMVITRANVVHALLYLIISLLAVALIFFVLGAPFVAALEVIIYAGAIMVLFLFAIMTLNLGRDSVAQEGQWMHPASWLGPSLLTLVLLAELIYVFMSSPGHRADATLIDPRAVGIALFGPYLLAVELASLLLLAGMVGAYYLGRHEGTEGPGATM